MRLTQAKFKINRNKSCFGVTQINRLGYEVTKDGVGNDTSKVEEALDFPRPERTPQVRAYIGLFTYMQPFILSYHEAIYHLLQLMNKTN